MAVAWFDVQTTAFLDSHDSTHFISYAIRVAWKRVIRFRVQAQSGMQREGCFHISEMRAFRAALIAQPNQ